MTTQELTALVEGLSVPLRDFIKRAQEPLIARIDELEGRPGAQRSGAKRLDDQREGVTPGVSYAGTFDVGKAYARGDLITRGGGLWLALNDSQPGDVPGSSPHYKLIVKSGGA